MSAEAGLGAGRADAGSIARSGLPGNPGNRGSHGRRVARGDRRPAADPFALHQVQADPLRLAVDETSAPFRALRSTGYDAVSAARIVGLSWIAQRFPSGSLKNTNEFQSPPLPSTNPLPS